MKTANFSIVSRTDHYVRLQDLGPWDEYLTITNAAEWVIDQLHHYHDIKDKQVFYMDSDNKTSTLLHDNEGNFIGHSPRTDLAKDRGIVK